LLTSCASVTKFRNLYTSPYCSEMHSSNLSPISWTHPDQVGADPQGFLRYLYDKAVQRALAHEVMAPYLPKPPKGRTLVLGAGKAGAAMAHALQRAWPQQAPLTGLVVTRYGHIPKVSTTDESSRFDRIELVEAAHPVPDEAGMRAAQRMLEMTQDLTSDDLVIFLISGGGSALLSLPADGLSLQEKQRINKELLRSGASISEMNCVRKHLSKIKGGRLAQACLPAQMITLAISDVPGDDPAIIASGPTVFDDTTCQDTLNILQRYDIKISSEIQERLRNGELETPKPKNNDLTSPVRLIATPLLSLQAAYEASLLAGLNAYILSDELEGESREVAKVHAALARFTAKGHGSFRKPCVLLSGGETTVTIRTLAKDVEHGRGGRAGEFCLGLTQALSGTPQIFALAADTDGIDGIEDNAGAFVMPDTLERARQLGMKIEDYLDRNDSYGFFANLNNLVVTGPTYTNVNDFRAILVL
jgi:glycerate 2-kinase